ncbi:MAG TPA: toll/interleukin-1 receptor domain-containing protein [Alphaproteobacteria bacterium]|nr:toll/interleukin-1 receptor domain-containing protein [Alphaproteobacteria bacterium]
MPHFMRAIDRVHAERQLITAFTAQMTWDDIDLFFKRLRIPRPKFSDRYTMEELLRGYLADCSDEILLDIAGQLGLDVSPEKPNEGLITLGDSKYWLIDHLRLFISHVHSVKKSAANLRDALQQYGISAFVAHEDIDTSDEWREEILRALMSMDVFAAILTSDFNSSKWTDQELGVAVARDVLMIPINKGENPYGFLAKYQALATSGLTAAEVAEEVFRTISTSPRTKGRMVESLTRTISTGSDVPIVLFRIEKLNEIQGVGMEDWERVRENVAGNAVLRASMPVLNKLNKILQQKGLEPIGLSGKSALDDLLDEIPF